MSEAQVSLTLYLNNDEDELLVEGHIAAALELNDYGVPGSPQWIEATDVRVSYPVSVDNKDYSSAELRQTFGEAVADRIEAAMCAAADDIDDSEWA